MTALALMVAKGGSEATHITPGPSLNSTVHRKKQKQSEEAVAGPPPLVQPLKTRTEEDM